MLLCHSGGHREVSMPDKSWVERGSKAVTLTIEWLDRKLVTGASAGGPTLSTHEQVALLQAMRKMLQCENAASVADDWGLHWAIRHARDAFAAAMNSEERT